ncbi:MAG: prepilin-type N-terminal cleavage/methylation domain-containing protein [Deltaproteobacteria bacterium]|nr:prepilin-type N-terminal cleavage/methylation domain-containing protein [Deltaproteobacteria bacterium]
MQKLKGFTLIEILITIAILAIVAGIATPSFQRMAINGNLKTAARDIAADFAQLKGRAISGDRDANNPADIVIRMYRISLNVAGNSYQLQQCNDQSSPCGGWTTIQNKNLSAYANDIIFDAEDTTVTILTFQTRGTVNTGTGNQETIVLRNSRNSTATIRINITGRTNVQFNMQ